MIFTDWRDADAVRIAPLYEAESRRWRERLGWDLSGSWAIVENGRRAGHVPGLVAEGGDGRVAGWTFFILHEGVLQIGGVVGERASIVRALLERTMQSNEARLARGFTGFLFPASSFLPSALARQRFAIGEHPYLVADLQEPGFDGMPEAGRPTAHAEGGFVVRPLSDVDPANVVRLMARAYAGLPEAKCFAPDARLDQWAHYLGQLLATPAIGRYLPGASFAVEHRDATHLQAAIVTTSLSPETAHVAQVVVDPGCRRSGLARRLIAAARQAAKALGHSRMSLLVSGENEPARRLYAHLGFTESARFLYASRPALMRQALTLRAPRAAAIG